MQNACNYWYTLASSEQNGLIVRHVSGANFSFISSLYQRLGFSYRSYNCELLIKPYLPDATDLSSTYIDTIGLTLIIFQRN